MSTSPTQPPEPAHLLGQELVRTVRATACLRAALTTRAPRGVEWSGYQLLFHLVRGGPQRQSELAEALGLDPSTVSRQVAALERLGLVERAPDPVDARARLLAATREGRATYRDAQRRRDAAIRHIVADWPERDVQRLTRLLARLNDGFDARRDDVLALTVGRATGRP